MRHHHLTLGLFSLLTITLAAVVQYRDPSSSNSAVALTLHARADSSVQRGGRSDQKPGPGKVCRIIRNKESYIPHLGAIYLQRQRQKNKVDVALITQYPSDSLMPIPTGIGVRFAGSDKRPLWLEHGLVPEADLEIHTKTKLVSYFEYTPEDINNLMVKLMIPQCDQTAPVETTPPPPPPSQTQQTANDAKRKRVEEEEPEETVPVKRTRGGDIGKMIYPSRRIKGLLQHSYPLIGDKIIFVLETPREQDITVYVSVAVLSPTENGMPTVGADKYLPKRRHAQNVQFFVNSVRDHFLYKSKVRFCDIEEYEEESERKFVLVNGASLSAALDTAWRKMQPVVVEAADHEGHPNAKLPIPRLPPKIF